MACSTVVYEIEPKEESLLKYLLDEELSQENRNTGEATINELTDKAKF